MDNNNGVLYGIHEAVCPVCGKVFYPTPLHAYKIRYQNNLKNVCTYHCMMQYRKEREAMIEARKKARKKDAENKSKA